MKIEIGESLIYSWLRHKKNCQLVQTNWKPSAEWNKFDIEWAEKTYHDAQKYFDETFQFDLFKKNSGLEQALQQAELDVIGVQIEGAIVKNIFASIKFFCSFNTFCDYLHSHYMGHFNY